MPPVKAIPDNYPRLLPYLTMKGAADAIRFYETVLGAKKRGDAMPGPDGTIGHAELAIGDSVLMLADPDPAWKTAQQLGGTPVNLCVYVEDCNATFETAKKHGAKVVQEPQDKFYGDRSGSFQDPWGYVWTVMTHIEDVAPDEMEKRAAELMQNA